jgi:hypothetical protein
VSGWRAGNRNVWELERSRMARWEACDRLREVKRRGAREKATPSVPSSHPERGGRFVDSPTQRQGGKR